MHRSLDTVTRLFLNAGIRFFPEGTTMSSADLVAFGLGWFSNNWLGLFAVLAVLVPVLALLVAGYAVHALLKSITMKKK